VRIDIADSNQFGTLTASTLDDFEHSLGTRLPEAYRKHLQLHNGGCVKGAQEICELHHVFGIHNGPDWARFLDRASYGQMLPRDLLPIADDPGGNLICIVLSGPDRGAVIFWFHERGRDPESLTKLAPDFDAYQRGLALKVALAEGRLETIQEAMSEVGPNEPVYGKKTILDLAFEVDDIRIVKLLVSAGSKIRPDALIEAVRNSAMEVIAFLLERGIDVNYAIPNTGFTALMLAASTDAPEIVELLLSRGADPLPHNRWGKSAADLAHSLRVKKMLGVK
jgi:SMI1 / KNR4 family (SUKH-1)/Ankyrin repeats (3 copies)